MFLYWYMIRYRDFYLTIKIKFGLAVYQKNHFFITLSPSISPTKM